MSNGLFMSKGEFSALPKKEQLGCLYENQVATLRAVRHYRLHQKIQYPWLAALTTGIFFLIKYVIAR